jgi:uncharacterized repeat protein (TIGR01451 family)
MLLAGMLPLLLGLAPGPAAAAVTTIDNTATVSYSFIPVDATLPLRATVASNTVRTTVLPAPTEAVVEFLRQAIVVAPDSPEVARSRFPVAAGSQGTAVRYPGAAADGSGPLLAIDGGLCRDPAGTFAPVPVLYGLDGLPIDFTALATVRATSYHAGEPVIVQVSDPDLNVDPEVREYVEVTVETVAGELEGLRMQETGVATGTFAAALQSVPVPPAAVAFDCRLAIGSGSKLKVQYVDPGSPQTAFEAAVDVTPPVASSQVLRLEQQVSRTSASLGDMLQYRVLVGNPSAVAATDARLLDWLPAGFRFVGGSFRRNGKPVAGEPGIAGDGAALSLPLGTLAPDETVTATFVVEVASGTVPGPAVNNTIAVAAGGRSSNDADTVVVIEQPLLTDRFTIIGRVLQGDCDAAPEALAGVPNVRVLLDDGTYAATDANGAYHFEGVRPGTHVVQLDPASIPAGTEPAPCLQNTRFAGRGDSQFVEAQGGSLVRSDFRLRASGTDARVGARLAAASIDGRRIVSLELDGGEVAVSGLSAMLALPEGMHVAPGSMRLDGKPIADPSFSDSIAVIALGDAEARWRRRLDFELEAGTACPADGHRLKAVALFEAGGVAGQKTPAAELELACGPPPVPIRGERVETSVKAAAAGPAASPFAGQQEIRNAIPDDLVAAGGGSVDWLKDQGPGRALLFPAEDYNPRLPITRVVVKHAASETVALSMDGEPVSSLHYEASQASKDKQTQATAWSGIPLHEGDNHLEVVIRDASGNVVATLSRSVHYAERIARVELVPEQSILVADGIHNPVVAVRFLDRSGKPMRAAVNGRFSIDPPYQAAQSVAEMQSRQLAGNDGIAPHWHIEGDDGIAYIELQPTSVAGSATLAFNFPQGGQDSRQELRAWLKSTPRDWVVVGFAAGSVGYATLKDNMRALEPGEDGSGTRADGQVSLYAKGRVLGKWMLTLAYDSDKADGDLRRRSLLSTIDPQQYYTLYGDGSHQGYDAASAEKLYLKLERDQFYALFGDFQTGLDRNELSRYQRTLNGVKVEYRGPLVEFNGFAAKTAQADARDEIPGDGTSGLYRLTHGGIVMNGERVRIETRDRYHSEQVLESRELTRHIDYDIDYDNGTLFFREPIASRDFDFNPVFIVVEYETVGTAEEHLNGGGRVGMRLMDDRLQAGLSYIRDEDIHGRSNLAGVDAKFRLTPADELRAEAATSRGDGDGDDASGNAWLLEWEHRGETLNLLAYARRQAPGFGLGQQNRSETGTFKAGVQGQWRVGENFSLQGEAYRVENLTTGTTRDAVRAEASYRRDTWNARAGLQWARDEAPDGTVAESRQVTLGASRYLLDKRLELSAQADLAIGGKNESVDFPTRLQLGAAYRISSAFRILAAQEFTDGQDRDTSTTRIGFDATPWANAKLTSTLNQSQITEYGARTFALFGLNQRFLVGERWGLDVAVDSSHAFNESGDAPLVVDPSQPIATGGIRDGGALTEDFVALSGGATYRAELWSWNARLEGRRGDANDRYGFTTAFLRQARDGVALSASMQAFSQRNADGSTGLLANAQLSWAYRPLGSDWSMLDKLEFHLDQVSRGTGDSIIGQDTLAVTGNARSRRLVNNFVLNHVSDAWEAEDGNGNVLDLHQRSQLSLYYGSKYVLDSFGGDDYAGYSDIIGAEWRFDIGPRIDIGVRSSVLHSWSQGTFAWSIGPSIGFSPFTNAWVSVGYNFKGFEDRDFNEAHQTARGAYMVLRLKFDQHTLGLDRGSGIRP